MSVASRRLQKNARANNVENAPTRASPKGSGRILKGFAHRARVNFDLGKDAVSRRHAALDISGMAVIMMIIQPPPACMHND
jgi:hypothetical protein